MPYKSRAAYNVYHAAWNRHKWVALLKAFGGKCGWCASLQGLELARCWHTPSTHSSSVHGLPSSEQADPFGSFPKQSFAFSLQDSEQSPSPSGPMQGLPE